MKINYLPCDRSNYVAGRSGGVEYIVIHYVGALGGAEDNAKYFSAPNRKASAHYFVGFDGEVWQSVKDEDTAWHCGGGLQGKNGHTFHKICTNNNSIGIEMCVRKENTSRLSGGDSDWYFEQATEGAAAELTRSLMDKYGISADHVIRHYDVTGKICPNPYVKHEERWAAFKEKLEETMTQEQFNTMMDVWLAERAEQPPWNTLESITARNWAEREALIRGDGSGRLNYQSFLTREQMVIMLYRLVMDII